MRMARARANKGCRIISFVQGEGARIYIIVYICRCVGQVRFDNFIFFCINLLFVFTNIMRSILNNSKHIWDRSYTLAVGSILFWNISLNLLFISGRSRPLVKLVVKLGN